MKIVCACGCKSTVPEKTWRRTLSRKPGCASFFLRGHNARSSRWWVRNTFCSACGKRLSGSDSRQKFCSLQCAARASGLGLYRRRKIRRTCNVCGRFFSVKGRGSLTCYSCRKSASDRTYVRREKPWRRKDPLRKASEDKKYYQKHRVQISNKSKVFYQQHKSEILKSAERYRRSIGVQPVGSFRSGPEVLFAKMLGAAGFVEGTDYLFRYKINPRVEADFLFPAFGLVVELMGQQHRTAIYGEPKFAGTKRSDRRRRKVCKTLNLRLAEFPVYGSARKDTVPLSKALLLVLAARDRKEKKVEAA